MGLPLNIDFQQVFLHLLNFLILTLGLYVLLYSPVVKFMEKRKAYYEEMDTESNQKREAAENLFANKEKEIAALEEELSQKREESTHDAQVAADFYIKEAKKESSKIKERAYQSAIAERQRILENTNHEVNNIIAKALDQAMIKDENSIYEEFLKSASDEGDKLNEG